MALLVFLEASSDLVSNLAFLPHIPFQDSPLKSAERELLADDPACAPGEAVPIAFPPPKHSSQIRSCGINASDE